MFRRSKNRDSLAYAPTMWPMPLILTVWLTLSAGVGWGLYTLLWWAWGVETPSSSVIEKIGPVEVTKVVLALMAAIGAVFTGAYAYRKQKIQEGDARRADAGVLADRYDRAAEQLGNSSSQAVRLAGVYAMSKLADDWPARRQQCVHVLCAYLCMTESESGIQDNDDKVRAAIIGVVRDHLVDEAGLATWSDFNFDFSGTCLPEANFRGAIFRGSVSFEGTVFSGTCSFDEVRFGGRVEFDGATFKGDAGFLGTRFSGAHAFFRRVTFESDASFHDAKFLRFTDLSNVTFSKSVDFGSAFFYGETVIHDATFSANTSFLSGTFAGETDFSKTTFAGLTFFSGATFSGRTKFDRVRLFGEFAFNGCNFLQGASVDVSGVQRMTRAAKLSSDGKMFRGWPRSSLLPRSAKRCL